MAFSTIPSALIQVGKAIKKSLFDTIKDDLDDHETRLAAVETIGTVVTLFDETVYSAVVASTLGGLIYYKAKQGFRVTKVEIQIFEKGLISSGLLEVDVLRNSSLNPIGFTSIMTSVPTINFATNLDFDTASGVISSTLNSLTVGDFLRVDVIALPAIALTKFRLVVTGELT